MHTLSASKPLIPPFTEIFPPAMQTLSAYSMHSTWPWRTACPKLGTPEIRLPVQSFPGWHQTMSKLQENGTARLEVPVPKWSTSRVRPQWGVPPFYLMHLSCFLLEKDWAAQTSASGVIWGVPWLLQKWRMLCRRPVPSWSGRWSSSRAPCQDTKCQGLSSWFLPRSLLLPTPFLPSSSSLSFLSPDLLSSLPLWSSYVRNTYLTPPWCLGKRQTDSCYSCQLLPVSYLALAKKVVLSSCIPNVCPMCHRSRQQSTCCSPLGAMEGWDRLIHVHRTCLQICHISHWTQGKKPDFSKVFT